MGSPRTRKPSAASAPTKPSKKAAAARSKQPQNTLVDKALKARWEEAIARYRKARKEETSGWDERYEALGDILDSDPPYYLAAGFKTARAFLQVEVPDQDERTVRTNVRVARYFDPDDEAKYGITKLDALLGYLEASGGAPLAPAKIRPETTKLRVQRGKETKLVPFAQATKEELRAATRAAASKRGRVKAEPLLVKAIRQALAKAGLRAVAVRLAKERVDIGGIPADRVAAAGKALATVKPIEK